MDNTSNSLRPKRASFVLFAAYALMSCGLLWWRQAGMMDIYEQAILPCALFGLLWLGWHWPAQRIFLPLCSLLTLLAVWLYAGDLARAHSQFWLKYLFASQSAVLWMCVFFLMAMLVYWLALLRQSDSLYAMGAGLNWAAACASLLALLVRWHESWLMGSDIGHIPVSNLYEVFILFCLVTSLLCLYFERRYQTRKLGALVLPVLCAAVGFIIWYSLDRQAHEIQPLIPALQSWWMKIHVPANFIGYGAFSIAAMLSTAQLLTTYPGFAKRLPSVETLEEITYRAIALGFLFFTLATILGALWAADAWGSYWSWDPKEVWALIVWLNYAAWLHVRLVKGWRGRVLAWWAVLGLLITSFAFIGVNMFLSGLHSYGKL